MGAEKLKSVGDDYREIGHELTLIVDNTKNMDGLETEYEEEQRMEESDIIDFLEFKKSKEERAEIIEDTRNKIHELPGNNDILDLESYLPKDEPEEIPDKNILELAEILEGVADNVDHAINETFIHNGIDISNANVEENLGSPDTAGQFDPNGSIISIDAAHLNGDLAHIGKHEASHKESYDKAKAKGQRVAQLSNRDLDEAATEKDAVNGGTMKAYQETEPELQKIVDASKEAAEVIEDVEEIHTTGEVIQLHQDGEIDQLEQIDQFAKAA